MRWRLGVVPRPWRPSDQISHHHFDRQPVAAYLPGVAVIGALWWYNSAGEEDPRQGAADPDAAHDGAPAAACRDGVP